MAWQLKQLVSRWAEVQIKLIGRLCGICAYRKEKKIGTCHFVTKT